MQRLTENKLTFRGVRKFSIIQASIIQGSTTQVSTMQVSTTQVSIIQVIVGTDYKISSISALNNYTSLGVSMNLTTVAKGLAAHLSSVAQFRNIFGLPWASDSVRLFDMLGYGVNSSNVSAFLDVPTSKLVNIFRFLAYQKVYYDNYRNPLYEVNNPSAYNVDQFFGTDKKFTSISDDVLRPILTLRYRNWSKDYFTCSSPQWMGADYLTQPTNVPMSVVATASGQTGAATVGSSLDGQYY